MTEPTFHLIPHVHWDREWYLSRSGFLARLVPMMDQVAELLEGDPSLRFHLDGQMIVVEDYLAVRPEARGTIEALARRGQLGLGPWYVLADELIPSGESLRRNLALGIRLASELGGAVPVLYCPDAFGHPAGLPTLAAEQGIPWAVVWRGLGRPGGRERDLHRWVAPDGSAVTLLHLPPQGYEMGIDLVSAGPRLAAEWGRLRRQLMARAASPEIAVLVGADHHAPDPRLAALRGRIAKLEPGATVRWSGFAEYFAAVERAGPRLGTITGELRDSRGYVWSLQGVHGGRARLKRLHAAAESRLLAAERGPRDPRDRALLETAWRRLLESQFHDTIAGCAADAVAEEQEVRLRGVLAVAGEVIRRGIEGAAGHDPDRAREAPDGSEPALLVLNRGDADFSGVAIAETTWFDRDVLVGPPGDREPAEGLGYRAFHLESDAGTTVPIQVLRVEPGLERIDSPRHYPDLDMVDRVWIAAWLDGVPAGGLARYRVTEGTAPIDPTGGAVATGRWAGNGLIAVEVDQRGGVRLRDLVGGRSWRGAFGLVSEADHGDLYTPDIRPGGTRRARITAVRPVAAGPLLAAIELRWAIAGVGADRNGEHRGAGLVAGRTVLAVAAGEARVRVTVELDNHARDHRLRLGLPGMVAPGGTVIAAAPIGSERRGPGVFDRSWPEEATLPTAPANGWLVAADDARGLRVDGPGFFEYQLTAEGDLWITLLRAVGELSRPDGRQRRGHAGWAMATPGAEEPGRHRVELVVGFGGPPPAVESLWIRRFRRGREP